MAKCEPTKDNPRRCETHYRLPLYPDFALCREGLIEASAVTLDALVLEVEPDPFPSFVRPDDQCIADALERFALADERQRARLWEVVRRLVEAGDRRARGLEPAVFVPSELCDGCRAPKPGPCSNIDCRATTITPGQVDRSHKCAQHRRLENGDLPCFFCRRCGMHVEVTSVHERLFGTAWRYGICGTGCTATESENKPGGSDAKQGGRPNEGHFYSENVLGVAPDGTPTPDQLRPEFRPSSPWEERARHIPTDAAPTSSKRPGIAPSIYQPNKAVTGKYPRRMVGASRGEEEE